MASPAEVGDGDRGDRISAGSGPTLEALVEGDSLAAARDLAAFRQHCRDEGFERTLKFYETARRYAACSDAVERAAVARAVVEFLRPEPPSGVRIGADLAPIVEGGLESSPPPALFDTARQEAASTLESGPLRRFSALRDRPGGAANWWDTSPENLPRGQRKGALPQRAERSLVSSMRLQSSGASFRADARNSPGRASGLLGYSIQAGKGGNGAARAPGRARSLFRLSVGEGRFAPRGSLRGESLRQGQHLRRAALKVGFLLKRGGRHPTWKRRWVALVVSGLGYFEDEAQAGPKGFIPFQKVDAFAPEAEEEVGRRFAFTLRVEDRVYAFQAANGRDKARWIDALLPFLGSVQQAAVGGT